MTKHQQSPEHPEDEKNSLEWVVFGLSLLMVFGILGYLIYQAIHYEPGSPDLVIQYQKDPSPHAPYRYHLTIKNNGQETAEEVQVEIVLEKDGEILESALMQIPYAPIASQREGWVNFSKNPADADTLYARVVSFKKP